MTTANVFFQIAKVDEAKRLVYGRATDETPDKADEIFDYASSKPHFQSWSQEVMKDSGGKSQGNIRSMHGKVAAGKVVEMHFDDNAKAIDITAKVVDENEWQKVLEGVHTGFSIGGRYIGERWPDTANPALKRYTAAPSEISLVDRPCNPGATFFEIQKADGAIEKQEFTHQPAEAIAPVTGEMIGDAMEQMLKAGELSLPEMLAALKGAVLAKKDSVADDAQEGAEKSEKPAEGLAKDEETHPVPSVGNMVNFMFGDSAAQGVITEAVDGHAKVQVGDLFIQVEFKSLAHVAADTGPVAWNAVAAMPTKSETAEVKKADEELTPPPIDETLSALIKTLTEAGEAIEKAGARNSGADAKLLQQAHDVLGKLGAKCAEAGGDDFRAYAESQKVDGIKASIAKGLEARLEKVESERDDLLGQLKKVTVDYTTLEARLKKVEDTPAAPKGKLMVVTKTGDTTALVEEAPEDDLKRYIVKNDKGDVDDAASMLKLLHAKRGVPVTAK